MKVAVLLALVPFVSAVGHILEAVTWADLVEHLPSSGHQLGSSMCTDVYRPGRRRLQRTFS